MLYLVWNPLLAPFSPSACLVLCLQLETSLEGPPSAYLGGQIPLSAVVWCFSHAACGWSCNCAAVQVEATPACSALPTGTVSLLLSASRCSSCDKPVIVSSTGWELVSRALDAACGACACWTWIGQGLGCGWATCGVGLSSSSSSGRNLGALILHAHGRQYLQCLGTVSTIGYKGFSLTFSCPLQVSYITSPLYHNYIHITCSMFIIIVWLFVLDYIPWIHTTFILLSCLLSVASLCFLPLVCCFHLLP